MGREMSSGSGCCIRLMLWEVNEKVMGAVAGPKVREGTSCFVALRDAGTDHALNQTWLWYPAPHKDGAFLKREQS